MVDFLEFYRVKDWYTNMGMPLIAALTVELVPNAGVLAAAILQIALIQMYGFSTNDLYDYRFWNEENYVAGVWNSDRSTAYLLFALPVAGIFALSYFTGIYTVLFIAFLINLQVYNGFPRLKENYLASILMNAFNFSLFFLYPYMVAAEGFRPLAVFFHLLFLLYMMLFEVAHQVEHDEVDRIYSIVDAIGLENSFRFMKAILIISAGLAAFMAAVDGEMFAMYAAAIFFSALRLWEISRMEVKEDAYTVRNSWHKFYTVFEGGWYFAVLALIQFV